MTYRTRKSALWLGVQGAWGTAPAANYLPTRAMDLGLVQDGKSVLETNYAIGRNHPTAAERGADGATLSFRLPVSGFSAVVGDGASPPTADAEDALLNNAFGTGADFVGEACAAGVSASSLELDTDIYNGQDLALVLATGATAGQWRRIADDSNPYGLDRNLSPAPAENDIVAGSRQWTEPGSTGGGAYLTACVQHDGFYYLLEDGRVSKHGLSMSPGGLLSWTFEMKFDRLTRDTTLSGLSVNAYVSPITTFATTPLKGVLAEVVWGGTAYAVKSVEIDFGIKTMPIDSPTGTNGRGAIEVIEAHPKVTIMPLFAAGWQDDFRAGTTRSFMLRLGSGANFSAPNTYGLWFEAGEIVGPVGPQDDGGILRASVQIAARDTGSFSGAPRLWRLARA